MSAQGGADTMLNDFFRWVMFHLAKRPAFFRYNSKFTLKAFQYGKCGLGSIFKSSKISFHV